MVKLRRAGYCNLKLFLLYLVVYGHWIEPWIGSSSVLSWQYRIIYLIHMPLFAFLSGLFSKSAQSCMRQIRRLLPIYAGAQGICILLGSGKILTPFWHLWYLLSCCVWAGVAWLWFRFGNGKGKLLILLLSLAAGLAAGYVPWLDRTLSGSRTVVLFPFFWAGVICPADISWIKYRWWGLGALGAAIALLCQFGSKIPVTFLYHAVPYSTIGTIGLRLLSYLLAGLLGFFLLAWMRERRFPWTRAGADTMPAYLLHGPLVAVFREIALPWPVCALASAVMLYYLYKIPQWRRPLYGIAPGERKDRPWPGFRIFTSPTQSRYTGFCSR